MAGSNLLTDKTILSEIRKGKATLLSDGEWLFLRLRGKGQRWIFRFKIPLAAEWASPEDRGKPVEIGLGTYPDRSLLAAREAAKVYRVELAEKRDPRVKAKPVADKLTFADYAKEYIDIHEPGWRNAKHRQQWRNTIIGPDSYAEPKIGAKFPGDISANHIQAMLLPLWANKTETANRVRLRVETIIDYAFVKEGIDRRNPARWKGNLDKLLPNPRKMAKADGKLKSHAAPPWREVPTIMGKLRDKPDVVSALALRFSILTAARSTEVRAATWGEMDIDGAVWNLPEERTKNSEAHNVPLSAEAVEILAAMKLKKHPDSDRVFPGAQGGLISDVAINKVLHAAYPGVTAHGIARSSFRDWVADATSFPDKVAEAALNHKNTNETEASYLRTKFYDRRVELMNVWADYLKGQNNIVLLKSTA